MVILQGQKTKPILIQLFAANFSNLPTFLDGGIHIQKMTYSKDVSLLMFCDTTLSDMAPISVPISSWLNVRQLSKPS